MTPRTTYTTRQDILGRFLVSWKDARGKRHTRTFGTAEEAQAFVERQKAK